MNLIAGFEINGKRFGAALLEIAANSCQGEDRIGLFPDICQGGEENLIILNQPHPTLIFMHALKVCVCIAWQKRVDHLDHISEFLERDPQTMDRGGLCWIYLTVCLNRS